MVSAKNVEPPRNILIIKPSSIGDIVHALPVLPRLRRKWPQAKLSWLISSAYASILDRHPMVDEVILFRRKRFGRGWYNPGALVDLAMFLIEIRRRRFDLVIDLQGLFRSAWVCLATGAPRRVGFANARELAPIFYNERVDSPVDGNHAVERYLKITSYLGCASGPVEFPLAVDDEDRRYIEREIPPGEKFAVLLPGTNWKTKRWPIENFAALVEPLRERFGLETVVAGSKSDLALTKQIPAKFNLTGKTNLRQTTALLERAELVIANDTGPMHLAAALGIPLVTPFGPTDPTQTGPYGRIESVIRVNLPCSPCFSRTCSHHSCMKWLQVEPTVGLAADEISRKNGRKQAVVNANIKI